MIARRLVAVAAAGFALAATAGSAHAQGLGIGGSIGANVPNGKFGDNATTGLVANGMVEARFSPRFGLRGELFWSRSDLDNAFIRKVGNATLPSNGIGDVTGDVNLIGGIGNLVIGFGSSAFQPYLIGGAGLYNRRVAQDIEGTISEFRHIRNSESTVGYNGGAGLRLSLLGVSMFVEARYHSVGTKSERTNFVPVTVGFMF